MAKRHKRNTPPRRRNRQVTVSMTDTEFDAIWAAAHHRGERVGDWLRGLGVAVATDGKVVDGGGHDIVVQRNERPGAYVTR